MIKIWNLIIEDRHCDVDVSSFTSRDAALEAARDYAKSVGATEELAPRGWEFVAYYGESTLSVRQGRLHGYSAEVIDVLAGL